MADSPATEFSGNRWLSQGSTDRAPGPNRGEPGSKWQTLLLLDSQFWRKSPPQSHCRRSRQRSASPSSGPPARRRTRHPFHTRRQPRWCRRASLGKGKEGVLVDLSADADDSGVRSLSDYTRRGLLLFLGRTASLSAMVTASVS